MFQMIRDASYMGVGGLPTDDELAALDLAPAHARRVSDACQRVAAIHDTGFHQQAWMAADTAAGQIVESLPEHQRDPGYLGRAPDPAAGITDPAQLAALVQRRW